MGWDISLAINMELSVIVKTNTKQLTKGLWLL